MIVDASAGKQPGSNAHQTFLKQMKRDQLNISGFMYTRGFIVTGGVVA